MPRLSSSPWIRGAPTTSWPCSYDASNHGFLCRYGRQLQNGGAQASKWRSTWISILRRSSSSHRAGKDNLPAMNDEHSRIRILKQRWDEEDASREKQEERTKQIFLEDEAKQTFAPIEDYLTRLGKVLGAAGASVEIDTAWQHLADQKLRRVAKISSSEPTKQLPLDFTIQGVSIFYRDKSYRFASGTGVLIQVITADVEQFLTPRRNQRAGS
jgi:hypothetical protein